VFTKTISLPANLAEADIESQVQIEANQYIPYPLDEISLDFEVLGPSPRNADMVDILLAASKNENVESRQDALESLGLKAKVVDVESFAMANAFELIRERDGIRSTETVGIFDIGFDLSTLLILRNGRVVYTRDHPFGGNQLTEEIMRRYDMPPEQANFFLRGEPGPENFEDEVLEPFMLNVVHQISRALQFYSSSAEFSNIRTIYLSGTMASVKGLADVVEQELGIKTAIADPVNGLDVAPSVAVTALNRNAPNLMVAMGLALRGFD
jgi:type IV pilus assembly protein PilM